MPQGGVEAPPRVIAKGAMAQPGELIFDVRYPRRGTFLTSVLVLFRWLFLVPYLAICAVLLIPLAAATLCAWFAILVTGRYPLELWLFSMGIVARIARVNAYALLLRHDLPPVMRGPYAVRFDMVYRERQSRPLLVGRWLLILPHLPVLLVLGLAGLLITAIAWVGILLTGVYPRPLFDVVVGVQRWAYRVVLYALLLTDDYPPFSFGPQPLPEGTVAVPESWALTTSR